MLHLKIARSLIGALLFGPRLWAVPSDGIAEIDAVMSGLHERSQFNGGILVAVHNRIVYRKAFGLARFKPEQKFTTTTISCLASVAKPFTSMAVMMLAEEGRVGYDDRVTKYLPELPDCYAAVSLRQLLTMTSGIVDYPDLGVDHPGINNEEVLQALRQQRRLAFFPGEKYQYCNANFVLLALVVERVTGDSFRNFLQERIFDRLGMKNTFVYFNPAQKTREVAIGFDEDGRSDDYVSLTTGDGGIYSNLEDLLKWDQALNTKILVRQSTLAQAFTPGAVRSGSNTYGFGWNVTENAHGKSVWHTGNTGGFRAYLYHGLTEQTTIIMLTNGGQTERIKIAEAILNILSGTRHASP